MFEFLRKLLGKFQDKPVAPKRAPDVAANTASTSASTSLGMAARATAQARTTPPSSSNPPSSFIRREALLNRNEQIAGYAFTLHEKLQRRLKDRDEDDKLHKAYDDALLRNLTALGSHSLLGQRLSFIHLSVTSIDHPLIDALPAIHTVLIFEPGHQTLDITPLKARLDQLRQQGHLYGWLLHRSDLDIHTHLIDLASQADFILCEMTDFDGLEIKSLIKTLHAKRPIGLNRALLIATGLNTFDEFNLCFQSGFDFFLGDFIISRENWHPPKSDINRLLVIKLLNLLRSDEDIKVVAQQVTADPVMTFKLLRYLNSPAMGLQSPVATIEKAVMILGRERFYRWLSLLLFDIKAPGFRERLLTEQALTRAFFLENLAGEGHVPNKKDELFILGLFSMLDLLIGQPLESILQQTHLPASIHAALMNEAGIYHDALHLACSLEDRVEETIEHAAAVCNIDAVAVSRYSMDALSRANEVMTISES